MSRPPTRLVPRLKGSHHKSGGLNPQGPLGGVHARPRVLAPIELLEDTPHEFLVTPPSGAAPARGSERPNVPC